MSFIKRPSVQIRASSYDSAPEGWNQLMDSCAKSRLLDKHENIDEVYIQMKRLFPEIVTMDKVKVVAHLQNLKGKNGQ